MAEVLMLIPHFKKAANKISSCLKVGPCFVGPAVPLVNIPLRILSKYVSEHLHNSHLLHYTVTAPKPPQTVSRLSTGDKQAC